MEDEMDETWRSFHAAALTERLGFWERKRLLSVATCQRMADGELTQPECLERITRLLRTINHEQLDAYEADQ